MKHNEILGEIYRVREKIAAEAGGDSEQLLAWVRAEEAKARARGVKFAPLPEPAEPSAIPASLGEPSAALAECGYADKAVIERPGRERPGLDLYLSVHREDAHAGRRHDWRPLDKIKAPKTPAHPVLLAMAEKLRTPEGKARYRRRACTVEPVFGILKSALGFASALRRCPSGCLRQAVSLRSARQFMLRGLKKVSGEWNLMCLACNLKRLHTLRQGAPAA